MVVSSLCHLSRGNFEKICEKVIVWPEIHQYESNYYRDLETLASEYFIQAQDEWNLSRDEISFYFAMGMNLSKYFRTEKEEEKDE